VSSRDLPTFEDLELDAPMKPAPQYGDIWEDLTPGHRRFVRVVQVREGEVRIHRAEQADSGEWFPAPRSPSRWTRAERFTRDLRRGFRLHHRPDNVARAKLSIAEIDVTIEGGTDQRNRQALDALAVFTAALKKNFP
jgi:hypothetical protein